MAKGRHSRSTARRGTSSCPRQTAASSLSARGDDDYRSQGYSTRRFHVEFLAPRDDTKTSPEQKQPAGAGSTAELSDAPLQTGTASVGEAPTCKQRPPLHKLTIPENVLFSTPPILINAASPSHGTGTVTPSQLPSSPTRPATPTRTRMSAENRL